MTITLERETAVVRGQQMPRTHSCIPGVCANPCQLRSHDGAPLADVVESPVMDGSSV